MVKPAKLVVGLLSASPEAAMQSIDELEAAFGPVEYLSPAGPFAYTDYYESEMGPNLQRRWIAHAELVQPDRLAELKRRTGEVERRLARADGTRRVNLDPGLLSLDRLVLASTKEAPHRIYLGQGIWAELTLVYKSGAYRRLDWTYPDYASETLLEFLTGLRKRYKMQLKERQ